MTSEKAGWFGRIKQGLSRSSMQLTSNIGSIFTKQKLDDATLEELEEALIMADLGVDTAAVLTQRLAEDRFGKSVTDEEVRSALAEHVAEILTPVAEPMAYRPECRPRVTLVAGVNGVGKTTTIGKLAKNFLDLDQRVMLAACDTFRAAAVEQLQIWGERNNCPVVTGNAGTDAAGLAFTALERAKREDYDELMIDTAGRLQNKEGLMDELRKIVRVLRKIDPEAPHDILLVLDATTGQNAFSQVDAFSDMVNLSGLIVTKLDGSAKGGVVVGLARRYGYPVHAIGVGEGIDDLRAFDPNIFARALLGLENVA